MKKNFGYLVWRSLLFKSFVVSGVLIFKCERTFSQVTPDNTLGDESSVVNTRDATSDSIDGGAIRGQNLFHSFQEFNVGEDRGVYFANPDDINNIFSRVTGNNVSNILGTLGVDGAANLFLINPNGIVFGEGASLDVQGSFTATTADGIEFGDNGFFSAVNPQESRLTISVPLGLQFGSTPGSIINRSFAKDSTDEFVGLRVPDGENLTFVGGDISFEGGEATVRGGKIEIGGLGAAGTVAFNDDGGLSFPDNVAKADVSLSNAADVDVTGTGGGSININARNLDLTAGESGYSQIRAGITAASTSTEAQAGDITIDITDNLLIDEGTVTNLVDSEAVGNAGDINIQTGNLLVKDGGQINSFTSGEGNAGDITIQARDTVTFDGVDSNNNYSSVASSVQAESVGDGGNVKITAGSLSLTNGGFLEASVRGAFDTLPGGTGEGGNVSIDVDDTLTIAGENAIGIFATLEAGTVGSGGDIDIQTGNLLVQDGGQINSFTLGRGNAGDITIKATDTVTFDGFSDDNYSSASSNVQAGAKGDGGNIKITAGSLSLTNGGELNVRVREASDSLPAGIGEGGNVSIDVDDTLTIAGKDTPRIIADLGTGAKGSGGDINIQTGKLVVEDGGQISASTLGKGDSGNLSITADNSISLDDSLIVNNVESIDAVGNAGKIDITTGSLSAKNGSQINSFTRGQGNAGDITIQARNAVTFNGSDGNDNYSSASSSVEAGGEGNGGNINITAGSLSLTNGGELDASISGAFDMLPGGKGQGGNVSIDVDDTLTIAGENVRGIFATLETGAVGRGGDIDVQTGNLVVEDGGQITASTLGQGDSGNLSITADNSISLDTTSTIVNNVQDINAVGDAGKIKIMTGSLSAKNGSQINSFTSGQGNAGDITIQARDTVTFDGSDGNNNYSSAFSSVEAGGEGDGGNIKITADSLSLTNGGQLEASVREAFDTLAGGKGQGGNIKIDVDDTLTITDGNNILGILATLGVGASGNGGNINIQTGNLVVKNGGLISASTVGQGDSGNISITADNEIYLDATSTIVNNVQDINAVGDAGKIKITTGSLSAKNGSQINSFTSGQGNAGDITIQARDTVTFDGSDGNENYSSTASNVQASAKGNGGNIKITAGSLSLTNGGYVTTSVREAFDTLTGGEGQGGNVSIDVDDTLTIAGENAQGIFATLGTDAKGSGGGINIQAEDLVVKNGGQISASTLGQGDSGNISITADNEIYLDATSTIVNNVQDINAVGDAGKIKIMTGSLSAKNGSQINSFTSGQGNAGDITIQARDTVTFDGFSDDNDSGASSNVLAGGEGNGGNINITASSLSLTNGGYLDVSILGVFDTLPGAKGEGGNININVDDTLTIAGENAPGIFATLGTGAIGIGGNINITAGNIRLRDDSDIRTDVFGTGNGGNINITADSIVAFDDSDIFASAPEGKGGDINLDTPAYFGENFTLNSLTSDPTTLDVNSRADVSATGAVSSGAVDIPNVSSIQNSLNTLPNNSLKTDELVANSCVVPVGDRGEGKFIITGTESLPVRPGDGIPSKFPTGEVRSVPEKQRSWQPGDPIVEPQGAYRLANGKLVLSRECSE